MRRGIALLIMLVAVLLGGGAAAATATAAPVAADDNGVSFTAQLNSRDVSRLSTNDPLALDAGRPLLVSVSIRNGTDRAVTVNAARIQGKVMGLAFFSYDTQIGLKVAAGATERSRFRIGLADLSGQAVGLLPATIALLDDNADVIASSSFTVDVDGDLTSIYGVFGLAVAALTALWLISLIVRLVRKALPANRWTRAVQFAVAGFGLGLTLTFTVSALRLLAPNAAVWLPFVLGAGAVGFGLGYLTPGPATADEDDDDFAAARAAQQRQPVGAGAPLLPPGQHGDQLPSGPQPWEGQIERVPLGSRRPIEPPPAQPGATGPTGPTGPSGSTGAPAADDTVPRATVDPAGDDDRDTIQGSLLGRHFPDRQDNDPRG